MKYLIFIIIFSLFLLSSCGNEREILNYKMQQLSIIAQNDSIEKIDSIASAEITIAMQEAEADFQDSLKNSQN